MNRAHIFDGSRAIAHNESLRAANDAVQPVRTMREIEAEANAECRQIIRAADLNAVEMDESFFANADLSQPSATERERRAEMKALERQQQREGTAI
jgi:hypothetical protein